jgi:hypothetical protein
MFRRTPTLVLAFALILAAFAAACGSNSTSS